MGLLILAATLALRSSVLDVLQAGLSARALLAIPIPASSDENLPAADIGDAMRQLRLIGKFDDDRLEGFIWDSARLLPPTFFMEHDLEDAKAATGLGKLVALGADGADRLLRPGGHGGFDPS